MASTYSSLKIELIGTGDQAGTWGTTTNTNLGTAIEEAITGSADVAFSSANVQISLTDTNASQTARNLRLNLTGTSGGARNLYVPAIEKQYIVKNGLADAVTVTNGTLGGGATGTGVAVAAGDSVIVFNDGTNVTRANTAAGTVTAVSVSSSNGFAGTSSGGTTPALTLSTTVTGVLKGNGTAISAAVSGTDYAPATSGTSILKGSGSGGFSNAVSGTDYAPATSGTSILYGSGSGGFSNVTIGTGISFAGGTLSSTGSGGTVTTVSVVSANGLAGTVANATTTPAITLSTSVNGIAKGNGTSFSTATAGTDYVAPGTATTFTALQTFSGASSVLASKFLNALEAITVSATAATGTINYDVTTQSIIYYTSNAAANWTVNFRASSGTSLNTAMATGESITVAFLVTQGSPAYYNNVVQVDGNTITPKWQGGAAPTSGNASSIDAYVYTIVKTGAATFTVFASQTQFA